ncbi:hypothetical protein ACNF49_08790 [Actinomadura sp. ATCC 39365]
MTIEDDLAEAMAAHVAEVQAGPGLGSAVRRGHRARVSRLRVAGAVIVTAAVAVTVPVMLNPGYGSSLGRHRPPRVRRAVLRHDREPRCGGQSR